MTATGGAAGSSLPLSPAVAVLESLSEPGKLVHSATARAGDVAGPGRFVLMEIGVLVLEMAA